MGQRRHTHENIEIAAIVCRIAARGTNEQRVKEKSFCSPAGGGARVSRVPDLDGFGVALGDGERAEDLVSVIVHAIRLGAPDDEVLQQRSRLSLRRTG